MQIPKDVIGTRAAVYDRYSIRNGSGKTIAKEKNANNLRFLCMMFVKIVAINNGKEINTPARHSTNKISNNKNRSEVDPFKTVYRKELTKGIQPMLVTLMAINNKCF